MIDEKNLINYIKTEINPYGRPFEGTVFEFGCKVMEYIENMEKVGEWIPCTERLPKYGRRYLVSAIWIDGEYVSKPEVYVAVFGSDGKWHTKNYEVVSYEVVAWMPLPEPYKE